jgi:hypothetical protein
MEKTSLYKISIRQQKRRGPESSKNKCLRSLLVIELLTKESLRQGPEFLRVVSVEYMWRHGVVDHAGGYSGAIAV